MNTVLLVDLEDYASVVLVNNVIVYHDDNDKGASNQYCSSLDVAHGLKHALGTARRIEIKRTEVPEDWQFDDIKEAALKREHEATELV